MLYIKAYEYASPKQSYQYSLVVPRIYQVILEKNPTQYFYQFIIRIKIVNKGFEHIRILSALYIIQILSSSYITLPHKHPFGGS